MNDTQIKFLRLAVVEKKTYAEIEGILKMKRSEFSPWWNEFKKERESLVEKRDLHYRKCKGIEFEVFENWFDSSNKKCHYCGITLEQIKALWEKYPELTKRKRGRKLEIERLEPNSPYSKISNLVWSCYWCNNAKTDTFTEGEFKMIGNEIRKIWINRLNET